MCFVRMIDVYKSTSQLHMSNTGESHRSLRAPVLNIDNQWEALDHDLMVFEWSIKAH